MPFTVKELQKGVADMNNTTSSIITIGREYGSAGRQIGQEVAKYFGIKCYDKELLEHAANDSGICKELFENHDEKPTNSFLYSLVMDTYSFGYSSAGFTDMPMNHKVFLAQFEAIKKLAAEGPCVMVGRCADYALADNKDCFSVFIHADLDWRIKRIAGKYNKTPKEAKDMISKETIFLSLGNSKTKSGYGKRILCTNIYVSVLSANCVSGNDHALDHLIRIAFHNGTIHKCSRVTLITVTYYISGFLSLSGYL